MSEKKDVNTLDGWLSFQSELPVTNPSYRHRSSHRIKNTTVTIRLRTRSRNTPIRWWHYPVVDDHPHHTTTWSRKIPITTVENTIFHMKQDCTTTHLKVHSLGPWVFRVSITKMYFTFNCELHTQLRPVLTTD